MTRPALPLLALVVVACAAQPAHGRDLGQRIEAMPDEAWGTAGGFVADGALTCAIVKRGGSEANPFARTFVGKHPSCGDMALFTAAKIILLFAGISALQDDYPREARTAARASFGLQAGIVGYQVGVAVKVKW